MRKLFFLRWVLLSFLLIPVSLFSEEPKKIKNQDDESSTVSYDHAREMLEYENYLMEKEAEQQRLRGLSKTQELLMRLREGSDAPKKSQEKKKEKEISKQEFVKEKLKGQKEGEKKQDQNKKETVDEEENKKLEEMKKKTIQPPPADLTKVPDDEKKKDNFFKLQLLVDYRSSQQTKLLDQKNINEKLRSDSGPGFDRKKRDPLEEVDFIREVTLSPYALQGSPDDEELF